ncbi:MAG: cysteine peptidase family C39 domain-containing protein [Planctomycetota bacterium]|jgi:hypothetical protein
MKKIISIIVLLSTISTVAFGDRQLDRTEILQIFQTLTAQPRNTWIPTGTIEATHMAYKASSGYMTASTVVVKYDGEKFYWEININSHTKETEPQGLSRDDNFDLNSNTRRVFVWNGEQYTMYFRPGNSAIVTENPTDLSVVVNGPLTAGIVPWGYGIYTFEELSNVGSSGEVDSQGRIHLTLNNVNMNTPEIVFILDSDPAKNYPVLSYSINRPGQSSIVKTYGDYEQLASGQWVPTTILIERYDTSKQTAELLTQDHWNINFISVMPPQADSFDVVYEAGAFVEYRSPISNKPLSYHYSNRVDIDSLLYDRLLSVATGDTQTQNCATIAMKYVSEQLGKGVTDMQLAELINEPNEGTSLYELRQFALGLGFYCFAAKTDIPTLRNLPANCQAVLHLPGPNHYVVLGHIDDKYVWGIDLDDNKFYYRTKFDLFDLDWSEGTALIISNEPLNLTGNFIQLSDGQLHEILGGFPNYSCSDLIQTYNVIFCSEMMGGLCGTRYYLFYNRYGCEEDPNGGSCTGEDFTGNVSCSCIPIIFNTYGRASDIPNKTNDRNLPFQPPKD